MQRKKSGTGLILSGVLLVLILALMLITDSNPMGLSKNAISKFKKPEIIFENPGTLAPAANGCLFNLDKQVLRKIDLKGNLFWEKSMENQDLLWMGPIGFITAQGDSVSLWDGEGAKVFDKQGILANIRVLDASGDFILISGKSQGKEHAALMNNQGTVLWRVSAEGSIISGKAHPSGIAAVLNLVDDKVQGRIQYIDSQGRKVWENTYENLILTLEFVNNDVCAVDEKRIFMTERSGKELWEYLLEGELSCSESSRDGHTALGTKVQKGNLNQQQQPKLFMISPEGELLWSYGLNKAPVDICIGEDTVFVADQDQIMTFSKDGLLMSTFQLSGRKQMQILDSSHIILNQDKKASVLKVR